MGKRKSSPRLSATLSCRYLYRYQKKYDLYISSIIFWVFLFKKEPGDLMRVIAGKYKGMYLQTVSGKNTRPTTDKVKEALFSMIGPFFNGGKCLDLYAGTGSLGIEAISRGMEQTIFIDLEKRAIETVWTNIRSLGIETQVEVYKNDAERALNALIKRKITFDLVFLDPPYERERNKEVLQKLCTGKLLNQYATVVVEHHPERIVTSPAPELSLWKHQEYGEIALSVFKYEV